MNENLRVHLNYILLSLVSKMAMDCNKEEAIRAKTIAEKKMHDKDFAGAWKIALKAQQLDPNLENISQMVTVCQVHCSAERRVSGSEMDWYGVLQIDYTTDEESMKSQYRKLALLLHPDKNRFEGAEAAFKLVAEAKRFLSDPAKRSLYDIRYKASSRPPIPRQHPLQQQTKNPPVGRQPGVNYMFVNTAVPQSATMNPQKQQQQQQQQQFARTNFQQQQQQQQTQSGCPKNQTTFWTACPTCNVRYQYQIIVLNKSVRCQKCHLFFVACELNAPAGRPGSTWNQYAVPQQNGVANQGVHNMSSQNNFQGNSFNAAFPCPGFGNSASKPIPKATNTSEVGKESKPTGKGSKEVDKENDKKGKKRSKSEDEKPKTSRKKKAKPNNSFNENSCADDFVIPVKNLGGSGSSNTTNDQNEASCHGSEPKITGSTGAVLEKVKEAKKQKGISSLKENLANRTDVAEESKQNGKKKNAVEGSACGSKSNSSDSSTRQPDPEFFVVPDPDFYEFDKDRNEQRFASDQLWAVYDTSDGMPRFYARIKKVLSPGFKVRITWLEADPDRQEEIDWLNGDLPVSCGKFKFGGTQTTEDVNMFSHLVFEKSPSRAPLKIYPRRGEIWALFKNWDMKWSSDPDNHRSYEFEFVEVLSDYAEGSSINIAYLIKLKGFVSLFGIRKEMLRCQIRSNELFRFSHRIPSYKTTGAEREGLAGGYFELDPASVPEQIDEIADLKDAEVVTTPMSSKINDSSLESPDVMEASQSPKIVAETSEPLELPEAEFYDFEVDRAQKKFQPGQVWALYCDFDGMPKYYARINNVSTPPDFKLHITWLEAIQPPKDIIQWFETDMPISCGTFRHGGAEVYTDVSLFSHRLDVKASSRNKYEIIPRKGEIWAMYKDFNSEWTCSDLIKCEYDIVEVIDNNLSMTKVIILELVDGFETVFKARQNEVSTLEIASVEILRFSHKVPAFQLTEECDGSLKGFWDLDPKSVPVCLFRRR